LSLLTNLAISFNAETVELYVCHIAIASCKEEKHPIVFCMWQVMKRAQAHQALQIQQQKSKPAIQLTNYLQG